MRRAARFPVKLQRWLLVVVIALAAVSVVPASAAAQWYKPWKLLQGKKKPQLPPLPTPPSIPALPTPTLPALPSAAGAAAAVVAGAQQSVLGAIKTQPAVPAMSAQQKQDLQLLVARARESDARKDTSAAAAEERVELWKEVQIMDSTNYEARRNYDEAKDDLTRARENEEKRATLDEKKEDDIRNRLNDARGLFERGKFIDAQSILRGVLAVRPDDPTAISLQANVVSGIERHSQIVRLIVIGVVALVVVVGLVWLTVIAVRRHRAAKQQEVVVAGSRKATLQVVDGVGRGRSAAIAGDVFRIGATAGDDGTRNDLVLSDTDARISRFHCNVTRRDGKFFLIDTSTHGTMLNGTAVRRGEPKRLASGDTMVLAESTAIMFMVH
jgi:hypothetical protein